MIKGCTNEEIIDHIIKKIGHYKHVTCYDIGKFDASQMGRLWEIEQELFNVITPKSAKLWRAIA